MGIYDRDWYRKERRDARDAERAAEAEAARVAGLRAKGIEGNTVYGKGKITITQYPKRQQPPPDLPLHPFLLFVAVAGVCVAIYATVKFLIK